MIVPPAQINAEMLLEYEVSIERTFFIHTTRLVYYILLQEHVIFMPLHILQVV